MKALLVLEDYKPKPYEIKRPVDEEYFPALAEGLIQNSIEPVLLSIKPEESYNLQDFDFAVFWGQRHPAYLEIRKYLPTLTYELPYLGTADQGWLSLGWDGLNGTANFCNANVDNARRLHYWPKLIKPWRLGPDRFYHLLIGQVHGDMSLEGTDINLELEKLLASINFFYPKDSVVFKPHPKAVEVYSFENWSKEKLIEHRLYLNTNLSLYELFDTAKMCVTYSSNTAVESVLYGVPTVAVGNCSMAKDTAFRQVASQVNILNFDRTAWLDRLSYCQWNLDEIRKGLFWKTLSQYPRLIKN